MQGPQLRLDLALDLWSRKVLFTSWGRLEERKESRKNADSSAAQAPKKTRVEWPLRAQLRLEDVAGVALEARARRGKRLALGSPGERNLIEAVRVHCGFCRLRRRLCPAAWHRVFLTCHGGSGTPKALEECVPVPRERAASCERSAPPEFQSLGGSLKPAIRLSCTSRC